MTTIRTFGRRPTLGEMKAYYAREDVISFLYDECQIRNVHAAFRAKTWPIHPTSKNHLRMIIDETIQNRIVPAYQKAPKPIDAVRLKKHEYLSFHSFATVTDGDKVLRFDLMFEADLMGWRRSFEALSGMIRLLDEFEVCYRMKYSGVRSLHLIIPCEGLPKQFLGELVTHQRQDIERKIRRYFTRHCGMPGAVERNGILRLAYSLNEDNGLVSLPISSDELPSFRPWEANIYNVTIDKPWHGDIPTGASRKGLNFLREVYNDEAKARQKKERRIYFGLEIIPKDRSRYAAKSSQSSVERWGTQLKSDDEAERVSAAWNLMTTPQAIPISILEKGLADENSDVRWYLTEAMQKNLSTEAIKLSVKMLWDSNTLVRISAIDTLVLAGEEALNELLSAVTSWSEAKIPIKARGNATALSTEAFLDAVYAINKIGISSQSEKIKSLVYSSGSRIIVHVLQKMIDSNSGGYGTGWYIQQLRSSFSQHGIESVVFSEAVGRLVPKLLLNCSEVQPPLYLLSRSISILQEIWRSCAIPLCVIREIADSLPQSGVEIPINRVTQAEQAFLQSVVKPAVINLSKEQKVRILVAFMICGKPRLRQPSAKVLLKIGVKEAADAMAIWQAFALDDTLRASSLMPRLVLAVKFLKQLDPSIEKSVEADTALSQIGGSEAVPALIEASVKIKHTEVNLNAARALAAIGDPAVPALLSAMRDEDRRLCRTAARVLGRIGNKAAVPALISALRDKHAAVRASAAEALGAIGSSTAVEALQEALSDKSKHVRHKAQLALRNISTPEAMKAMAVRRLG